MDINKVKIIVSIGLIMTAVGTAYFLDFPKWREINSVDGQITQVKSQIEAKKNYYAVIDLKIKALDDAGWSDKRDSLKINFDSSLFFTPKINNFFKAIVESSGMKLSSMTSSLPESTKIQPQVSTMKTESGVEISKTQEIIPAVSNTFNQLQGPIRKTTVNLNVTGTYGAFKNLLNLFQGQTRIITIKSVAVSSAGQSEGIKTKSLINNLSFSIILDVYSY